MRQVKARGLLKQMSHDIREVRDRLIKMESLLENDEPTKEELRQVRISDAQIKRGKYVTLRQLKEELGMK